MNTESLKAELLEINDSIRAIETQADAEKRDLTLSEQVEIDRLFAQFRDADTELMRLESRGTGRKTEPNMPMSQGFSRDGNLIGGGMQRNRQLEIVQSQSKPFQGRRSADLFNRASISDMGGFKSGGEFFQCVAKGLHHPGLVMNSTMTENVGSDGGYSVPSQLIARIFDESLESEIIRPRAQVFPMASNELNISGIDYTDHSSTIGGLDMVWLGQGATASAMKAQFKMVTLRANKGAVFTEASSELVFDSPTFERQMIQAMAASVGFGFDEAFIRGTGVGQPMGILNSPALISVPRESGQAPDSIIFENIVNMWARLASGLWRDAIWICNSDALPQLLTMTFPTGAVNGQPLFLPSQNVAESVAGTIFGRPLFFSEKCSTIGDQGDIILCNPMQYAVGLRLDAAFDRSIAPGFMRDVQSFRLITRAEGQPLMNAAITPRNGVNTLSAYVTLDDRA